jgi:hypothetical protein
LQRNKDHDSTNSHILKLEVAWDRSINLSKLLLDPLVYHQQIGA